LIGGFIRGIFFLVLLSTFATFTYSKDKADSCEKSFLSYLNPNLLAPGGKASAITKNIIKSGYHGLKAAFYPVFFLPKGLYHLGKGIWNQTLWESSKNFLGEIKKDLYHIVAYFGILFSSMNTGVSISQIDSMVENQLNTDSVVVVVNGFPKSDPLHNYVKLQFEAYYKNFKHAHYIDVGESNSNGPLYPIRKIIDISKSSGKVNLLKIFGHGTPGTVDFLGYTLTEDFFTLHEHQSNGWNAFVNGYEEFSHPVEVRRTNRIDSTETVEIKHELQLTNVMAENSNIVVYGCSTARGEVGTRFLNYIGMTFADKGATVYGSQLKVEKSLVDQVIMYYGGNPSKIPNVLHGAVEVSTASINLAANLVTKFSPDPERLGVQNNVFFVTWDRIKEVKVPSR
jgi:hypothetical protein